MKTRLRGPTNSTVLGLIKRFPNCAMKQRALDFVLDVNLVHEGPMATTKHLTILTFGFPLKMHIELYDNMAFWFWTARCGLSNC